MVTRVVCAAYWFHPLVWMAWRQLILESEPSCDDAVIARSEATAYADQLVGLARRLLTAARSPLLAMANRSDLANRVGAGLDHSQRRGRAGSFAVALGCAVAVAALTMSPAGRFPNCNPPVLRVRHLQLWLVCLCCPSRLPPSSPIIPRVACVMSRPLKAGSAQPT